MQRDLAEVFLRVKKWLAKVFECKRNMVEVFLRVKRRLAEVFGCREPWPRCYEG